MCVLGSSYPESPVTFNGTSHGVRNTHMNAVSWVSPITSWIHWSWLMRICKTLRKAELKNHLSHIMHRSPQWWYHAYKKAKTQMEFIGSSLQVSGTDISHISKHTCAHVDTHESHFRPFCRRSWPSMLPHYLLVGKSPRTQAFLPSLWKAEQSF